MTVDGPAGCDHAGATLDRARALMVCPLCRGEFVPEGTTALTLSTRGGGADRHWFERVSLDEAFLSRFALGQVLGRGSFGMVIRATTPAGGVVALKFLALLDDQEALARFVQEGRLLARIRHPNVIRTYEMGELDEHPYMVVEYLPGGTLQDRLASGRRIGLGDAVRVACDCLNGLQACHERGVIHRDLKPANVLFTGDGLAKIADLGVASYYGARDRMTRPGEVLGTPRYMAPEQAAGQPVSVESDLYSLALILYEMVAGRPPFDASTPVEWMTNHLEVPAAPLRAHVHDVPDRLARVVDRALSKRADQRPPTASDFLAELSRCPVPPPAREEPPPPARPAEVESTVRKTAVSMPQVKITPDDRDVGRAYDSPTSGAFRLPSPPPPAPTTPDRPAVTTTVELLPDQLRQFEDRAAAGDAQAACDLGYRYETGEGLPVNFKLAVRWYQVAAERGYAVAQHFLGRFHELGRWVPRDNRAAMEWYQKAAQQRHLAAQNAIGLMYEQGKTGSPDPAEAARWYRMAAEEGLPAAQMNLGRLHANGTGVAHDEAEAVRWFRLAAQKKDVVAQACLGAMLADGRGAARDDAEAVHWFRAALVQGSTDAQRRLARMYAHGRAGLKPDDPVAVELYRRLAERGVPWAFTLLGRLQLEGKCEPTDPVEAAWTIRRAAELGDIQAQWILSTLYEDGRGVEEDRSLGLVWLRRAAGSGHADAQFELALRCLEGRGVPRDDAEGERLLGEAADQGHGPARQLLASRRA